MSKYTAFRCPEDLLVKAKAKANKVHRSLSNYLITLIARDVDGPQDPGKAGKTAPLKPSPRDLLVAAKALPPSKKTHLLQKRR